MADVCGQRVFVLWRSYGNRSADERRMVIAHELVHAALVKRTGGRIPAWLTEGIAMYASGDKRAGDAGALLSGAQLRDTSKQKAAENALSLTRSPGRRAGPHVAGAAGVRLLVLLGGRLRDRRQARPRRRCCGSTPAFNSEKYKGPPGRKLSDRVMRRTLKTSLKSLEERQSTRTPGRSSAF